MKRDARRFYLRAALGGRRTRLQDALRAIERKCYPRKPSDNADSFHRAMAQMIFWPAKDELSELDSAVLSLALTERKKSPTPRWKAYVLVDQRWPGYCLVSRLNALILRARNLLEEAGESGLTRLRREAEGSGERVSEARGFLAHLRAIKKNIKEAAKITWQDYQHLLFQPGVSKRTQLACGDSPASLRVLCYSRALEIIVDHEVREPLRDKARPLLEWIARVGNPAYSDLLKWDDFAKWMAEHDRERAEAERAQHKRAQDRERQRRYRKGKISR